MCYEITTTVNLVTIYYHTVIMILSTIQADLALSHFANTALLLLNGRFVLTLCGASL